MKFKKAPTQDKVLAELEKAIRLAMRRLENKSMSGLSNLWKEYSRKLKGELIMEYKSLVPQGRWSLDIAKRSGLLFRMEWIVYRHMADFNALALSFMKSELRKHYEHEYYTAAYMLDVTTPPNIHVKLRPQMREANIRFAAGAGSWTAWHERMSTWTTAWESALRANILLNAVNNGTADDVVSEVDATRIGTPAVTFWDAVSRLFLTTILQTQSEARADMSELNSELIQDEIWQTMEDERVCDECDPLNGLTREETEDEEPPLHPRCRCFYRIMPRQWIDMADRELAHAMDVAGVVPDGMYMRDPETGDIKGVAIVSFNKWADDKIIALGTK